jgi:hypothetical protein
MRRILSFLVALLLVPSLVFGAVNLHQSHFRFGVDSGTEATHPFIATEDLSISQRPDFTFLIRFVAQETGNTAAANTDIQLERNLNGGAWGSVTTTSSVVKAVVAAAYADAATTTNRLTGSGGTDTSNAGCSEDGLAGGNNNDIPALGRTESLFSIQIVGADVVHGDVIGLRITSPDWTITQDGNAQVSVSENNGFQASSPTSRYGFYILSGAANQIRAQKFVCPGAGAQEATEIGVWINADAALSGVFRLAIFAHDAANNNPDTMVANSESAELSHDTETVTKKSHTYSGTKPQLTGGGTYWISIFHGDANLNVDRDYVGGTAVYAATATYPTWPAAAAWDSYTDDTTDYGLFAVYQAAAPSTAIKTVLGVTKASVKTVDGLAIGSVKSIDGLE